MSSILDALRKVEAEKAKRKVDLGEVEELLAERDLLVAGDEEPQERATGRRRLIVVSAMIALTVTAGVAAFFIYGFVRGRPPAEVTESQAPSTTPAQLPQVPAQVTQRPAEPQETPSETVTLAQPQAPEPTVPAPAATGPTAPTTEPPAAEPLEAAEPVSQPATPATVAERATAAGPAQPALDRPTLKINILRPASEQFPTPLAVVNGKKVGIGDYVDGARVIKIQRDGIVFEYGDDLFLVKF